MADQGRTKDLNRLLTSITDYTEFMLIGGAVDGTNDARITIGNFFDAVSSYLADYAEMLENKTIDADNNIIANIVNANIKANAAIAFTKLADLTASRALVINSSGKIEASAVTAVEIAKLSGLTKTGAEINAMDNTEEAIKSLTGYGWLYEEEYTSPAGVEYYNISAADIKTALGWGANEYPNIGIIYEVWEFASGKWESKLKASFYVTPQTIGSQDVFASLYLGGLANAETEYRFAINCRMIDVS